MRKLASIQKIDKITPIENADSIEVARILGWNVVIRKEDFVEGDLCVYCEIDSILPDKPEFEFLKNKKFRIRTIKLRGQISQGIAFPLSILPDGMPIDDEGKIIGTDVTEMLGVIKFEKPIPIQLAGQMKGQFPSMIKKTDEPRVQSVPEIIKRYKGREMYATEKLDGTSATFYYHDGTFGVCSRNIELIEDDKNLYWRIARKYNLKEKMIESGENIAVQGEIVGKGIQGNKYDYSDNEIDLFVFSVFDIKKYEYLNFYDMRLIVKLLDLKIVPFIDKNFTLNHTVDQLISASIGKSLVNPKIHREGIVIRPLEEINDFNIGRVSFKAINPKFLLKYEE